MEAQRHMSWVQPRSVADADADHDNGHDIKVRKLGSLHRRYETVEDLSGAAKVFYDRAAWLSGLSTAGLVRAVFKLEQLLMYWTDHMMKGGSLEDVDREAESVQSRSLARMLGVRHVW